MGNEPDEYQARDPVGWLMAMMGMLPMIGNMVGLPSAWVGFFVHMVISATVGGSFAVLLNASGLRGGVELDWCTASHWWILGPLSRSSWAWDWESAGTSPPWGRPCRV